MKYKFETIKYITKGDTIIFDQSFDEELDLSLLTNYQRLIFSDYELSYDLFDAYEKKDFKEFKLTLSIFDHPVNDLPLTLTHLTIGWVLIIQTTRFHPLLPI